MIRGVRKNTVFVQLPREKYFESAYFIIRSDREAEIKTEEMVKEANRIIESSDLPSLRRLSRQDKERKRDRAMFFSLGMLGGVMMTVVIWLITLLL